MEILLHTLILKSGERFPVLLDGETGIPLRFPLLFSYDDRRHGGVARMKLRLRRIRDLYGALTNQGIDLDGGLLAGKVSPAAVERALLGLELPGSTEATPDVEPPSPTLRNGRITAWGDFLAWGMRTALWRMVPPSESEDELQIDRAVRLRARLDLHRISSGSRGEVYPFGTRELRAVEEVLVPGEDRAFPGSPWRCQRLQWRAWILYLFLRWGGIRLGEALKLKWLHLPEREPTAEALIRDVRRGELRFSIVRAPDDPEDSRRFEPSVKRYGRNPGLPNEAWDWVWEYKERFPPTSPFVFNTVRGQELSYSTASKAHRPIREAAVRRFEDQWPGEGHSLQKFRWHRLRHTRACEVAFREFANRDYSDESKRRFCDRFGWANINSAMPYVRYVLRNLGDEESAAARGGPG